MTFLLTPLTWMSTGRYENPVGNFKALILFCTSSKIEMRGVVN